MEESCIDLAWGACSPNSAWTLLFLWVKLTKKVTAPWYAQNWFKILKLEKKGPKKTLKSPIDPLRIKWWGPKHLCELIIASWYAQNWSLKLEKKSLWGPKDLRSSNFCELSLHTEFQSHSTSPSIKLFMALQNRTEQNKTTTRKSPKTMATSFRHCSTKETKVFPCALRVRESADARAN